MCHFDLNEFLSIYIDRKCIVINFYPLVILATLCICLVFNTGTGASLVFLFFSALKTMFNLLNEAVKAIELHLLPGKLPISSFPESNLKEILCLQVSTSIVKLPRIALEIWSLDF